VAVVTDRVTPLALAPASGKGRALTHVRKFVQRKPLGALGALIIVLTVFAAVFGARIRPYDPYEQNFPERLQAPGIDHWLGTDQMGRDIFSRVITGARVSLEVGAIAVGVAVVLGSITGIVSGYYGGPVDMVVQRWLDVQISIPGIILAMVVIAVLGGGLTKLMFVLGIFLMPGWSRVIRGSTLSIKEHNYIEAARTLGASDLRVLAQHILPNVFSIVIILASTGLATAILAEASLSFLGLGASPDTVTWGGMLSRDARIFFERAWWMAAAPGFAISLVVLGFMLLGDALRDVWDPRLRGV
jgi:peptide/nickel transport system permease protein